jgi:hypothetical protein
MQGGQLAEGSHADEYQQQDKGQQAAEKTYPEDPDDPGYLFGELLYRSQIIKVLVLTLKVAFCAGNDVKKSFFG